jgi:hypothetical protein
MDEQLHAGAGQPEGVLPPSSPQPFTAPQPPRPPRRGLPRWLKVGGVAAALLLGVGGAAAGANALIARAANGPGSASPFSFLNQTPFAGHTGHPNGFGRHGRGGALTVSSVSSQSITTKDASGATVTVNVSGSTQYTRLGKAVSLSAITAGETIHVRGTRNSDGSIAASRIDIEVPSYGGQVTAISGSTITIQDRQGASHTIHTSTNTTVERADATSIVSAIAAGDQISASGAKNSDGSLNAEQIMVQLPHADGQIQSVSSSALTVKNRRGNTITIHLSASTRYETVTMGANGPTRSATTFSALKAGSYISAEGARSSDGSLNAEVVTIMPAAPHGGPHGDNDHSGPNGSNDASGTTN